MLVTQAVNALGYFIIAPVFQCRPLFNSNLTVVSHPVRHSAALDGSASEHFYVVHSSSIMMVAPLN
jgi:hypothetical protein